MKERPILFSPPMVRAILGGTKTQTRRVLKQQPRINGGAPFVIQTAAGFFDMQGWPIKCPYGKIGDRFWVRETFYPEVDGDSNFPVWYRADEGDEFPYENKWKPSIFMPRWASRITLEVTGVRMEILQDISEADAIAEGVRELPLQAAEPGCWWTADVSAGAALHARTAINAYRLLWESINGPGSWDKNPWVWVVGFKKLPEVAHV